MDFGVIIGTREEEFKKVAELGIPTIQMWIMCTEEEMTDEHAERVKEYCKKYNIRISAAWCSWSGYRVWNLCEGHQTLGLVPRTTRNQRIKEMKLGSDFAKKLGIKDIITHVGFLPENPMTTEYLDFITDLRGLAEYVKNNDQYFLFETGQETPVTLLRTIEDVGTGNLGINLDPANLMMYGKGNPIDALDVFGKYVRGVHIKDGCPPTGGRELGPEMPVGKGKVNFPVFLEKLKNQVGYTGPLTLEREIEGERQKIELDEAQSFIRNIWESI